MHAVIYKTAYVHTICIELEHCIAHKPQKCTHIHILFYALFQDAYHAFVCILSAEVSPKL